MTANRDVPGEPRVSIVIPAYNEAARLPENLARLHEFLDQRGLTHEVIVVDDGSGDDTADLVASLSADWPALVLVRESHRGKGGAIRTGVLAARGALVMLADADFSMPVVELERFDPEVLGSFDIAIGSREASGSRRIGEPAYRHAMGRVFNRLVQWLLLPGIQDTQCGFKCMRREIAQELCACQTLEGLAFDCELLVLARHRGYTIREIPITWQYVSGSKVRPLLDTCSMFADVIRVRLKAARGDYNKEAAVHKAAGAPLRGGPH